MVARLKLIIPVVVSALIIALLFSAKVHRTESVETVEMELASPYLKALASMGQKSSFESILSAGGTKLVERVWDEFKFDLKRAPRLSSWEMHGSGRFKVRSENDDFSGEMEILQTVDADREGIWVSSNLSKANRCVVEYETKTFISNSKPSVVRIENRIVYKRLIPFWMAKEVDSKVREHNKKKLDAIAHAIKKIVDGADGQPAKTAHQYFLPLSSALTPNPTLVYLLPSMF